MKKLKIIKMKTLNLNIKKSKVLNQIIKIIIIKMKSINSEPNNKNKKTILYNNKKIKIKKKSFFDLSYLNYLILN